MQDIRSTLLQLCSSARMYPSTVASPVSWFPTRYVLCDDDMKYSDSGRVMSCTTWPKGANASGLSGKAGMARVAGLEEVEDVAGAAEAVVEADVAPAGSTVSDGALLPKTRTRLTPPSG